MRIGKNEASEEIIHRKSILGSELPQDAREEQVLPPEHGPTIYIAGDIWQVIKEKKPKRGSAVIAPLVRYGKKLLSREMRGTGERNKQDEPEKKMKITSLQDIVKKRRGGKLRKHDAISYQVISEGQVAEQVIYDLRGAIQRSSRGVKVTLPELRPNDRHMHGAIRSGVPDRRRQIYLEHDKWGKRIVLKDASVLDSVEAQGYELRVLSQKDFNSYTFRDLVWLFHEAIESLQGESNEFKREHEVPYVTFTDLTQGMELLFTFADDGSETGAMRDTLENMHAKDKIVDSAFSGDYMDFVRAVQYLFNINEDQATMIWKSLTTIDYEEIKQQMKGRYGRFTDKLHAVKLAAIRRCLSETNISVQSRTEKTVQEVFNAIIEVVPEIGTYNLTNVRAEYLVDVNPQYFAEIIELMGRVSQKAMNLRKQALQKTGEILDAKSAVLMAMSNLDIAWHSSYARELTDSNTVQQVVESTTEVARDRVEAKYGGRYQDALDRRINRLSRHSVSDGNISGAGQAIQHQRGIE